MQILQQIKKLKTMERKMSEVIVDVGTTLVKKVQQHICWLQKNRTYLEYCMEWYTTTGCI
jgi:hypothetical protein